RPGMRCCLPAPNSFPLGESESTTPPHGGVPEPRAWAWGPRSIAEATAPMTYVCGPRRSPRRGCTPTEHRSINDNTRMKGQTNEDHVDDDVHSAASVAVPQDRNR